MPLIGAVFFEQNDEWQNASHDMMVEAFAQTETEEMDPLYRPGEILLMLSAQPQKRTLRGP